MKRAERERGEGASPISRFLFLRTCRDGKEK
jgi:hypothetical protein